LNNLQIKQNLIFTQFTQLLSKIPLDTKPLFGKMNVHQMVEHMTLAMKQANGNILFINTQTAEENAIMYRFMMSNKPFRENTPNSYLPDYPLPIKFTRVEDSILELESEIKHFKAVFTQQPDKKIMNPFFGNLNFEEWSHLLNKHMLHHLKQFGVVVPLDNE
jgi:hypothetical protein